MKEREKEMHNQELQRWVDVGKPNSINRFMIERELQHEINDKEIDKLKANISKNFI